MANLNTIKTTVNATIRTETAAGGITPGEVSDILDSIINEIRDRGILFVADYTAVLAVDPTDSKQACDISTGNVYRHNGTSWVLTIEPGAGTGGGGLITLATPSPLTATPNGASGDTVMDISWTNVSGETSFYLEFSLNGTSGWTQIGGTIAANTTTYQHTGRTAATAYYYRVKAVGDGVTYSDSSYATGNGTTDAAAGPDADASAYLAVLTSPSPAYQTATDNLFKAMKSGGYYSKIHGLWLLRHGTTFGEKKWNAVNPLDTDGAFRLVQSGAMTIEATGITGGGGHLDTKYVLGTSGTLNNTSIGFYCTDHLDGAFVDTGSADGTNEFGLGIYSGSITYDTYNFTGGRVSGSAADTSGFFVGSRTANNANKIFRNGAQVGTTATTDGGALVATYPVYLMGKNNNGAVAFPSSRKYALFFIGTGLSDAEVAAFNTAVQTWITATA